MKLTFTRSHFLSAGITPFTTLVVATATAKAAQFQYKWATVTPADYSANIRSSQICDAVKNETNGRLELTLFPNGALGNAASLLEQLRLGSIQFFTGSAFSSIVPSFQITNLGFAYKSSKQALDAMDRRVGAYIRKELAAKGIYAFDRSWDDGFRQITSSVKPIRAASDLVGFKVRTQPSPIIIELFNTLGASAVPLDANQLYTGLQTHIVDGQESALPYIDATKLYEVQRYVSITNHVFTNGWLAANGDAWNALPSDIQESVKRNVTKFVLAQRRDAALLDASSGDNLRKHGLIFNTADTASMRAQLGSYYARWKSELGADIWRLLEASVGRLG